MRFGSTEDRKPAARRLSAWTLTAPLTLAVRQLAETAAAVFTNAGETPWRTLCPRV